MMIRNDPKLLVFGLTVRLFRKESVPARERSYFDWVRLIKLDEALHDLLGLPRVFDSACSHGKS